MFGWGNCDGEPPLKRGLNDLDGCVGQPIVIKGGFFVFCIVRIMVGDIIYLEVSFEGFN